jgi:signal transduction histidine kinase
MPDLRLAVRSVRFRVTTIAVLVVAVVLVGSAMALFAQQRRVLLDSLDESLVVELDGMLSGREPTSPLDPVVDDDGVAQLVDGDDVLASTPNVAGRGPIAPPPERPRVARTIDEVLPDDGPFRVVSDVTTIDGRAVVVHVGAPTDDIEDAVAVLRGSVLVGIPVVVALLGAMVWLLVGRTLAPVESIRARVATIGPGGSDQRVPVPATGDEIAMLAETMNQMLGRLEDGINRERRFVADASHELRTPLTRVRTAVELDLAHPDQSDTEATLRSVLGEMVALERLVDDLLTLARQDATQATVPDRPVDLDEVVWRSVERLRGTSTVRVDTTGVSAAQVTGDERQLDRALSNVVENALRHARTVVGISVGEIDGRAEVAVADDGPGIPTELGGRIFDRFARADEARHRADGGTGLGLAITRDIIERHGGTAEVDQAHQGGARLVLRLPLRRATIERGADGVAT